MSQRRNRRSGVEDRWRRSDGTPSAKDGRGKRWRARYVDDFGVERERLFTRKVDAQKFLDGQVAALVAGTHVDPATAAMTVEQWCGRWIEGYAVNRASTVRQARTHIKRITAEFGHVSVGAVRPSMVKSWTARLKAEGLADSTVYALHSRLSQILGDAAHDGVIARNPCSRRTSPPMGKQKVYVATREQVWLLHDAMPEHMRAAVLLGAFAGLRVGEVAGLRVCDIDFIRGIVQPVQQYGGQPLKTAGSDTPVPIPSELALMLSASVQRFGGETMATNGWGRSVGPWVIEREFRRVKAKIEGLPEQFTFHDLRHFFASTLIASGADIKTVQARLRHHSASTTLDVYGHMFPDADESTRLAIRDEITRRVRTTAG